MSCAEALQGTASVFAQERLRYLLDSNRNATLKDAVRAEPDASLQLDNLVTRLKVGATMKTSN